MQKCVIQADSIQTSGLPAFFLLLELVHGLVYKNMFLSNGV